MNVLLKYEQTCWEKGLSIIAGVDEAGRGPLAGPVVASAVSFKREFLEREVNASLDGINDSKKISEKKRDHYFDVLRQSPDIDIGIGISDYDEIDRDNILVATHKAMIKAVKDMGHPPEHVLVDGNPVEGFPCESTSIVGGDALSISIASASIIAKVIRDNLMMQMDMIYPQYGFAKHKGYGTKVHMAALAEYGPSPIHRMSFKPVRESVR